MKLRLGLCAALMAAGVLSGCEPARNAGAGAALPFAAIGDTVLLPFQGLGHASTYLIEAGDNHLDAVRENNKGKVTLPLAECTAGICYVPGYALLPFHACTPEQLYPMTRSCMAVLAAGDGPATNRAQRAAAPTEPFKEW